MTTPNRVYMLQPYRAVPNFCYLVVLPDNSDVEIATVQAAWSYAVRYTAKGLDLPDHEAALALLKKRHPSWTIIYGQLANVTIDLGKADNDVPEDHATSHTS